MIWSLNSLFENSEKAGSDLRGGACFLPSDSCLKLDSASYITRLLLGVDFLIWAWLFMGQR